LNSKDTVKEEKEAEGHLRRLWESPAELEHSVQISEIQIIAESQEEVEKVEPEDYMDGVEEEKEDELRRRLWEKEAANKPSTEEEMEEPEHIDEEMSSTTQESNVQAVLREVEITSLMPLSHQASSHELIEIPSVISVEPYSKSSRELPRKHNYEKVLHKIMRKGKHNKTITKDRNKRKCSKRKFRSIVNSRFKNGVKLQKQCHSPRYQEISNPYRKEVRDEGGTLEVVPLGKQIELISYY
jgi:hypothetical protein